MADAPAMGEHHADPPELAEAPGHFRQAGSGYHPLPPRALEKTPRVGGRSATVRSVTAILTAGIVLLAALSKGPSAWIPYSWTPLLSLVMDVKAAVVVLILPDIVMDGLQFARRGAPMATVRRFAVLLVFGAVGTVVGTRLLVALSSRAAT